LNITFNTDETTEYDSKTYIVSIGSIPTYNYHQDQVNAPLIWQGTSTEPTIPSYKTNLGYFNATFNLNAFTFADTKDLFMWSTN
jgi:hypothetical protein